jgi:CrcB protein
VTDARPPHRQPRLAGLVFLGGASGTLGRWAVGLAVPHVDRLPLGTFGVNVVGTGFCGGFTTYSALANDTSSLLRAGLVGHALAYALGTVVLGLAASALGIAAARRGTRGRVAA